MSRAGSGPGPRRRQGESWVLRSCCCAGFGLSKGWGSGGAAEWFWGEESVTLLLGFLLAVLSDPTFPPVLPELWLLSCRTQPCVCAAQVVFGSTSGPFPSREYHSRPGRAHTYRGLLSWAVALKAAARCPWDVRMLITVVHVVLATSAQLPVHFETGEGSCEEGDGNRVKVTAGSGMPSCLHPDWFF